MTQNPRNLRSHLSSDAPTHRLGTVASVFLAITLFGCSTYQNITGYFNTYYNAKKVFADAVIEVENSSARQRDSLYFVPYGSGTAADAKFEKVIEKCSKLIESYEKSAWVDDAILMIGESYVYRGENESARRKFRELLDNFPTSDLVRQAKLWDAKAAYFMKKEADALKITKELFDESRSEGDNDVLFELLMLEAQIASENGDYAAAATQYSLASQTPVDDGLRARAQFQLGIMYERQGDPKKAAEAYGGMKAFNSPFALEFQSRLKYGRMLTASQQYDKALIVLDELFEEQLKTEERALVDLEIANTHWARGDSSDAFALYSLIDTTYARTDASAKGYYQRGVIYEKTFLDLEKAKEFYAKAKDEFGQSEVTPLAQRRSNTLTNYFKHRQDILLYDSLQRVASHFDSLNSQPDSAGAATDTTMSRGEESEDSISLPTVTPKSSSAPGSADSSESLDPTKELPDSLGQEIPPAPDEATDDEREVGRRREGRNTAMNQALSDSILDRVSSGKKDSLTATFPQRDTSKTARMTTKAPAAPVLSADSIKSLLARAKFELGAILFLELQLPDSALLWYQQVVRESPNSPIIPRTLYAMAEIYRTKGDSAQVDSMHDILVARYPKSEYAAQAMKLRGLKSEASARDAALVHYEKAERLLGERKTEESIQTLLEVIAQYPASPLKPQAMYTIGWIYENPLMNNDSAAAWYDRLVKEYPGSVYAAAVQAKLAVKADPKALDRYVKIKEIHGLQPEQSDRRIKETKPRGKEKGAGDEELQNGRRNRERDVEEDEEEEEEQDNADEDDDN
ncbi:MAG TPA: tetratricopeptide repeat protein [Bacteroidota bacterium]|jgi:TolA-binding protein|nr:tetratricopeptide repeat protein [Bacteroidota bacterium]